MKDPLVLLPGINCSERLWRQLDLGVEAIHPEWVGESIDAQVEHLLDVLPRRFSLAGLGLGGVLAMTLSGRAPERVSRLCVISTTARAPGAGQVRAWQGGLDLLKAGHSARHVQRLGMSLLFSTNPLPEWLDIALAMADDVGEETLAAQFIAQLGAVDLRPSLGRIGVPTLVLCGEADQLTPLKRHREVARLVPESFLISLPGAGHLLPVERPDDVSRQLRNWLAGPANLTA